MRITKHIFTILILLSINQGCLFYNSCDEIELIDFGVNEYPAYLNSITNPIKVDHSFKIILKTPHQMLDRNGKEHTILNSPDIWVRFSNYEVLSAIDTTSFFNIGETLHSTFDEYFDQNILIGNSNSELIFRYQASLINNEYILEIEYKAKKEGIFLIDIWYDENRIMIENDHDFECINFIQPRIYWEDNPINKFYDYFSMEYEQLSTFVIEIEK